MKLSTRYLALVSALLVGSVAYASDVYNTVPSSDAQYKQCLRDSAKKWEGGDEKSPVKGQSKAQAFCTCLWNETPDDFRGNLAKFSESTRGAAVNKICEKHSNWSDS